MASSKRRYDPSASAPSIDTELFDEVFDRISGRSKGRSDTPDSQATVVTQTSLVQKTTIATKARADSEATVAKRVSSPLPLATDDTLTTDVRRATVDSEATVLSVPRQDGQTSIPNLILDSLLPALEPLVSLVYLRLYRLSHGFHSDTCLVGYPKLARSLNLAQRSVIRAVEKLERLGLVKREGANLGKGPKGNIYRVMLPRTIATETRADSVAPLANPATVVREASNKCVVLKETHTKDHKNECVGMKSRFGLEECRRFADHLRKTDQGITNPGGFAMAIHRTGEADTLIEAFLESERAQTETRGCPDCEGRGFKVVERVGLEGVVKCKHDRLRPPGEGIEVASSR